MTTIALPIIASAAFADPNVTEAVSTGGTLLRLLGSNFGMVDALVSLTLTTADGIALLAPNCTFVEHHVIVDCTLCTSATGAAAISILSVACKLLPRAKSLQRDIT